MGYQRPIRWITNLNRAELGQPIPPGPHGRYLLQQADVFGISTAGHYVSSGNIACHQVREIREPCVPKTTILKAVGLAQSSVGRSDVCVCSIISIFLEAKPDPVVEKTTRVKKRPMSCLTCFVGRFVLRSVAVAAYEPVVTSSLPSSRRSRLLGRW